MSRHRSLKKPKLEAILLDDDDEETGKAAAVELNDRGDEGAEEAEEEDGRGVAEGIAARNEQEEALLALVEHRTKEVEHLRRRVAYYQSQMIEAERRLNDSQSQLARIRCQDNVAPSKSLFRNGVMENETSNPIRSNEGLSQNKPNSRPALLIPDVKPKICPPVKFAELGVRASGAALPEPVDVIPNDAGKLKAQKCHNVSSKEEAVEIQHKGTKGKIEKKKHKDLIPLIGSCLSSCTIQCRSSSHIPSQHKRKLRNLALCPVNGQLFVTSALDGVFKLWQIQDRGSGASLLGTTDCLSPKQRRWPEDIAWHPEGCKLFSAYTADAGDSQISVFDLNKTHEGNRVTFLEDRPHVKGLINTIAFMPWDAASFVTGGCDHAVICWSEKGEGNSWKPKALHRALHSSAVMGVAGMQQNQVVISVSQDKKIIGFDAHAERAAFKQQIDCKCMSILPNPCDFNLFMVQTGAPERQLRLFDARQRLREVHAFGWKQESSDTQSALVNQSWSPDGLYLSSGSADPAIHVFDIRSNAHSPSRSIKAHQKRVFKAEWHASLPLLISISSDLNIGLHRIS